MRTALWALWLIVGLSGASPLRAAQPMDVIASFSVLADVVREVGGPAVRVHALVGPDEDAHVYQPRPSDLQRVSGAALVVRHGLGFDPWMPRLIAAASYTGPVVEAARAVEPLRSGAGVDPHAWHDPRNVRLYVDEIASALARLRPAQADEFRSRAARYRSELAALDEAYRQALLPLAPEQRRIVISHDAFGYLSSAYGLEVLSPQGWSTQAQPTARSVALIIEQLRRQRVRAVFFESVADRRLVDRIAAEAGTAVGPRLYSDALAPPGHPADSYLGMMRHNLRQLRLALEAAPQGEGR